MPAENARRGRPKGSGLDDRDQLLRVTRMLEADPHMRPTTAIKAIGISDPSTIRRLRDKLREAGVGESGPFRASGNAGHAGDGNSNTSGRSTMRTATAREESTYSASEDGHYRVESTPRAAPHSDAVAWLVAWCGVGLHALSTTVEAQLTVFEGFLSVPQVASAVRQQLLLNEHVVAFCSYGTDVRTTLH